jgi:hypothetical protein
MINASRVSFGDIVLVPFPFTDQSGTKKRQPTSRPTGCTNYPDLVAGTWLAGTFFIFHGRGGVGSSGTAAVRSCYQQDLRQMDPIVSSPDVSTIPADLLADFEAAARRPLRQRMRYAFIHTHKPVLDDADFRAFDTTADYRRWCENNLPDWLGYGSVRLPAG